MRRPAALVAVILLSCPSLAWAHGRRAQPGTWWLAWNWDPLVLVSVVLLAWCYGRGLARLWARVGVGRKVRRWQAASYYGGLGAISIALLSPLDALSEELSSLHMVQHMVLMMVAASLFILGSPTFVLAWGFPQWARATSLFSFAFRLPQTRILWQPQFLWGLFAVTLYAWHHPILYQAALRDPLVHDTQHLSFFIVACLFWRSCLDPLGAHRLGPLAATLYLFTTSLHASALGVFLALSPRIWYGDYLGRTSAWGLAPLEDQQLAGLIMWMPACLVYPAVAAALFGAWLTGLREMPNPQRGDRCPIARDHESWIHH